MDGGPIHIAIILYLLHPELFTMVPVNIDISFTVSPSISTMAVWDLNHVAMFANAYLQAKEVDVEEVELIDHKLRKAYE